MSEQTSAKPHPLQERWEEGFRKVEALAHDRFDRGPLLHNDVMELVSCAFTMGWDCAWQSLQESENRQYMAHTHPDAAGSELVREQRELERFFVKLFGEEDGRRKLLPWQRRILQQADAAKQKRAGKVRGETLRKDAAEKRATWMPQAQAEWNRLTHENPQMSREERARRVARKLKKLLARKVKKPSCKSILRYTKEDQPS